MKDHTYTVHKRMKFTYMNSAQEHHVILSNLKFHAILWGSVAAGNLITMLARH